MATILMNGTGNVLNNNNSSVQDSDKLNHLLKCSNNLQNRYKNRQRRLSIEESTEEEEEETEESTESSDLSLADLKTTNKCANDVTTSGSLQFISTIVTVNDGNNSSNNSHSIDSTIAADAMRTNGPFGGLGGVDNAPGGDIDQEKALHNSSSPPVNGGTFVRFGLGPQPPLPPPPPPSNKHLNSSKNLYKNNNNNNNNVNNDNNNSTTHLVGGSLPSTNSIKKSASTVSGGSSSGSSSSRNPNRPNSIVNLICSRVLVFLYLFLLLGVAFVGGFIFAQHYFRSHPACDPSLSSASSSLSSTSSKLNPNNNNDPNNLLLIGTDNASFNSNSNNSKNFTSSSQQHILNSSSINSVGLNHSQSKVLPPLFVNPASFVNYENNDNSINDNDEINVNNNNNNNHSIIVNNRNFGDNSVVDVEDSREFDEYPEIGRNFNWKKIEPIESNLKNNDSIVDLDVSASSTTTTTTTTTSTTTTPSTTTTTTTTTPSTTTTNSNIPNDFGSSSIDPLTTSTTTSTASPPTTTSTTTAQIDQDPMVFAGTTLDSILATPNGQSTITTTTPSSFQTDLSDTVSSEFDSMFRETIRDRFPLGNGLDPMDQMLSTEIKSDSILPLTTPGPRDSISTTIIPTTDLPMEITTQMNMVESTIRAATTLDNISTTVSSANLDGDSTVASSSELSTTTIRFDGNLKSNETVAQNHSVNSSDLANQTLITTILPSILQNNTTIRNHKSLISGSMEDEFDDYENEPEHIFVTNQTLPSSSDTPGSNLTTSTLPTNSSTFSNVNLTDVSDENSSLGNTTITTTTITENKAKLELMNLATFDNQDFCLQTQFLCPTLNSSSASSTSADGISAAESSLSTSSTGSGGSSTTPSTSTKCLDEEKKCDGIVDCPLDRFDERDCKEKKCQQNFMCGLPILMGTAGDGTNGAGSLLTMMQMSPSSQFNTTLNQVDVNGTIISVTGSTTSTTTTTTTTVSPLKRAEDEDDVKCIPRLNYCDGIWDCADGSDEIDCQILKCRPNEIKCRDSSACITGKQACDGVYNCRDHSDEIGCVSRSSCELSGRFFCDNGLCIERSLVCDGRPDCHNGTDEHNCQTSETCTKSNGKFLCQSGECIESSRRCDGHVDCLDYSDEDLCYESDQEGIVHIYNANTDHWSLLCVSENFTQSNADTICSRMAHDQATNYTLIEISRLLGNSTWAHLVNANETINQTAGESSTLSSITTTNQTIVPVFSDSFFGHNLSIVHSGSCRSNYTVAIECRPFACSATNQQQPSPPTTVGQTEDAVNGTIAASESVHNNVNTANNNVNVGLKTPEEMPSPMFIGTRSNTGDNLDVVKCPAYVIAYRWMLTSGQCLKNILIKSTIKDLLIENSLKSWNSSVVQIRYHPKYSIFRTIRFPDYDTALVEFDSSLSTEESSLSSSICLPASKLDPEITCFIGAYGSGEAAYEVLELANCNSSNHFAGSLTNRHLCASPANSGSSQFSCLPYYLPLSCLTSQSQWYLSGFVTYQHGCSVGGKKTQISYQAHPTLFSNLFVMKSFIDQTIGTGTYRKERPKIILNRTNITTNGSPTTANNNGAPSQPANTGTDGTLLPINSPEGGRRALYILRADEPRSPKQFVNISINEEEPIIDGNITDVSNSSAIDKANVTTTTTELVSSVEINNNGTLVEGLVESTTTNSNLTSVNSNLTSTNFNSTTVRDFGNSTVDVTTNSTTSATTTTTSPIDLIESGQERSLNSTKIDLSTSSTTTTTTTSPININEEEEEVIATSFNGLLSSGPLTMNNSTTNLIESSTTESTSIKDELLSSDPETEPTPVLFTSESHLNSTLSTSTTTTTTTTTAIPTTAVPITNSPILEVENSSTTTIEPTILPEKSTLLNSVSTSSTNTSTTTTSTSTLSPELVTDKTDSTDSDETSTMSTMVQMN